MLPDKSLSFTATLSSCGSPIVVLGEWARGSVVAAHPTLDPLRATLIDAESALGAMAGSPDSFEHDREVGLIDFEVLEGIEPVLLYFRHSNGAYRLYVRSGRHMGEGVFSTSHGLLITRPIDRKDPPLWTLRDAASGSSVTLPQVTGNSIDVQLAAAQTGEGVALNALGLSAGYLAISSPPLASLTLEIAATEVDWLSAS